MNSTKNSAGWLVTMSALGINLILGVLYSWSVIKKALVSDWGWSNTDASLPFTISAVVFAIMMIFAGKAQDKFGPRVVILLGGITLGLGLFASGFATSAAMMVVTFGVVGGLGIGLGYSATTPSAIKWFDPSKKGLISGIVVSGIGLSPVYMSPLTNYLLKAYGIQQTFFILGAFAMLIVVVLSFLVKNPPEDTISKPIQKGSSESKIDININWNEVLKDRKFYGLWVMYMLSATAGLMLIGHLASIASTQAGWQAGFILVVILSAFNAGGRLAGGVLSDKVGRSNSMLIVFLIQAVNMLLFLFYKDVTSLIIGSAIAGLAYGALFSLFPAATADYFGIKNLGVNYGFVFTGWGVAGVIGPLLGGIVADATGSYNASYLIASGMLFVAAVLVKFLKMK